MQRTILKINLSPCILFFIHDLILVCKFFIYLYAIENKFIPCDNFKNYLNHKAINLVINDKFSMIYILFLKK
jgi:hypothetical protein